MGDLLTSYIPAGGEGTRLYPHTLDMQKPMLLMGDAGRRIIDYALDLSRQGDRTFVATNAEPEKAEPVEQHVESLDVGILRDKRRIGAASILDYAEVFLDEGPDGALAIIPADYVHEGISLSAIYDYHRLTGADITLVTSQQKSYGDFVKVRQGYAHEPTWSPSQKDHSITGIYIISNSYLKNWIQDHLKAGWGGQNLSMSRDLILPAITDAKTRVAVYRLAEECYLDDAGTLDRYHANNMRLSKGANVISQDARVAASVAVERCVILGGVELNGSQKISNSIISGGRDGIRITQLDE